MESIAADHLPRLRILLVDPDLDTHHVTFDLLSQHHEVFDFLHADDALDMLRKGDPVIDVIMVDAFVPGENSDKDNNFLIIDIYREFGRRFPIIALSDISGASAALGKALGKDSEGAVLMLKKPVNHMIFDTLAVIVSYHASVNLPGDVAYTASA